jgi:adenine-specific DNA-methyltransferase
MDRRLDQLRAIKLDVARSAEPRSRTRRLEFAIGIAVTAIETYWRAIQREHAKPWPIRPPFDGRTTRPLDAPSATLARTLGETAADVDPVTAGYFIGSTYAGAIPRELRARLGVYYTPPAIAARLLDQAAAGGIDWASCSVLDPACGGGAFLAPAAERIVKALSHLEPGALLSLLAKRVRGFEIDPVSAWMSQVLLEAMVLPVCRAARRRLPIVVDVRNTLDHDDAPRAAFDLVVGNPPYGRVTLAPVARARYAASLYGHANLYGLFTDVALRWVKPGGVVAYVTPTSFLAGEYFKNLRRLLARTAPPLTIDFIAERKGVFDEVLQETMLATYRRLGDDVPRDDRRAASVTFVAPVDEMVVRVTPVGTFSVSEDGAGPWLVPRNAAQDALIDRLRVMTDRLADWGYEVSTGPLVWNRHKSQLRTTQGVGCLPLVWAEAVRPDGTFRLRATKVNHRPYFRPGHRDGWLVINAPCVLVQRTTAKEQSRRLIAAVLPERVVREHGGAVVENHLNMVRPIGGVPAISPRALAAFLNSGVADAVFRCFSGSVAVSAYELESLPLPPARALDDLEAAVHRGAPSDEIDRICAHLYGPSGV